LKATVPSEARVQSIQELEQIFERHYELVYRTAYGVTGSVEDAEDVLQTIFLRLLGREFPPDLTKSPEPFYWVTWSLQARSCRCSTVK